MNVYYVAGLPYSDELYHHGVKGQKWGIRRFQNPDGSLTEAGRKRYGADLGEYGLQEQGVIRKLATGDWALGKKRGGERREKRLEKKVEKMNKEGKDASKFEIKLEAQKQRNVARDKYNSSHSTGVLFAQKFFMGRSGADAYRVSRERGGDMITSAVPAFIEGYLHIPVSTAISAKTVEAEVSRSRRNTSN